MHAMAAFIEENRRFGRRRLDRHVRLTSTGLRHHFANLRWSTVNESKGTKSL
jgi:hypothetical protein